jgi:DNA-binding transcriptional ArsR family regulator
MYALEEAWDMLAQPPTAAPDHDVLPAPLEEGIAARLAELFKALSDPTRVRLLGVLLQGERCVGDLAARLGLSQSAVSHQLRGLRQMRLVRVRRVGRQAFYALDDDHISDLFQRGLEHVTEDDRRQTADDGP